MVNDSADDTSGILVVLASSVWLGAVGFSNRKLLLALCCCVFDRRLAPAAPSLPVEDGPTEGVQVGRLQGGQPGPGPLHSTLIAGVAGVESWGEGRHSGPVNTTEEIVDATAVRGGGGVWDGQLTLNSEGDSLALRTASTSVERHNNPATA